jgi:4'-phosphopantetheinyl transferase EntD
MFPSEANVISHSCHADTARDSASETTPVPPKTLITNTLNAFLETELPSRCVGAVREILPGDEQFLTAVEARAIDHAVLPVKRSSGAGRFLARQLCARIGFPVLEIPRSSLRYPVWPSGLVGSISHDREFSAAVVGLSASVTGIGIDIESQEQVCPEVASLVASNDELQSFSDIEFGAKAVFSIKEAVFKAVYPNDRIFLEFEDVLIDRRHAIAQTIYDTVVHWRMLTAPRVLAVAWY